MLFLKAQQGPKRNIRVPVDGKMILCPDGQIFLEWYNILVPGLSALAYIELCDVVVPEHSEILANTRSDNTRSSKLGSGQSRNRGIKARLYRVLQRRKRSTIDSNGFEKMNDFLHQHLNGWQLVSSSRKIEADRGI